MPFLVYKIFSQKKLEHIETFAKFREARAHVRDLRGALTPESGYTVRMIFANDTIAAEKLLTAPRDERVIGEE